MLYKCSGHLSQVFSKQCKANKIQKPLQRYFKLNAKQLQSLYLKQVRSFA